MEKGPAAFGNLKCFILKTPQRHTYSLEALKLQFDIQAMLSPRVAHRMMWNRTVNLTGGAGKMWHWI